MHARMASGVLLALGFADLAVLNLLFAPRLKERDMGRLVVAEKAPRAPSSTEPAPPHAAAPACPPPAPCAPGGAPLVEAAPDVAFDINEVRVTGGDAAEDARRVAHELLVDPRKQLLLRGHADRLGTTDGNLALSRLRAEAVLRLLAAYHAPLDRVTIEAVGDADPADSSDTPTAWARNRRVQLLWR